MPACTYLTGWKILPTTGPPGPVFRLDINTKAAISVMQCDSMREQPYALCVVYVSATSSERLGLVTESELKNGGALFTFNTSESGIVKISVVGEFRVGLVPLSHEQSDLYCDPLELYTKRETCHSIMCTVYMSQVVFIPSFSSLPLLKCSCSPEW